jgi:dihydroorotate dehydrogenase (NAD+) catalytic subunit
VKGKNLDEIRFVVASGAWAYGERSLTRPFNPAIFDAITTRTLTLGGERLGNIGINPIKPNGFFKQALWNAEILKNRKKVLRKISGGWINQMGWWNIGFDCWRDKIYPKTKETPKIISIGGFSIGEYLEMIRQLNEKKVIAVELNISCPNVKINWEGNLSLFADLMKQCRAESKHSLIVKLSIEKDYLQRAKIAEDVGIDAISTVNTVKGLTINSKTGEFFYGGISGKRIKEIGLRTVAEIRKTVSILIFGGGGIYNWKDCQEYFWAGADAVSFGSIFFFQFWKTPLIVKLHKNDAEKIISKRKQEYGH